MFIGRSFCAGSSHSSFRGQFSKRSRNDRTSYFHRICCFQRNFERHICPEARKHCNAQCYLPGYRVYHHEPNTYFLEVIKEGRCKIGVKTSAFAFLFLLTSEFRLPLPLSHSSLSPIFAVQFK